MRAVPIPDPQILALGDSLTAGYGLPAAASFAAQLEGALRAHHASAVVHNAGVSGDTTEGALRRLPRLLGTLRRRPNLAIVELGANDLLRGVPPERTRANLDAILLELDRCGVPALLATFEPPAAFGPRYRGIYEAVAAAHGAATVPFFPPGVLGHRDMVLADGIHPNARAIARVVEAFLPSVLARLATARTGAAA